MVLHAFFEVDFRTAYVWGGQKNGAYSYIHRSNMQGNIFTGHDVFHIGLWVDAASPT